MDLREPFSHLKNDAVSCLSGCQILGVFTFKKKNYNTNIIENVKIQNFIIPLG